MTIKVNIGEAKTRLSELVAACERGETVVLARAGRIVAQIIAKADAAAETPAQAAARRAAALAANRAAALAANGAAFAGRGAAIEPSMTDAEIEERWQRKFGAAR